MGGRTKNEGAQGSRYQFCYVQNSNDIHVFMDSMTGIKPKCIESRQYSNIYPIESSSSSNSLHTVLCYMGWMAGWIQIYILVNRCLIYFMFLCILKWNELNMLMFRWYVIMLCYHTIDRIRKYEYDTPKSKTYYIIIVRHHLSNICTYML